MVILEEFGVFIRIYVGLAALWKSSGFWVYVIERVWGVPKLGVLIGVALFMATTKGRSVQRYCTTTFALGLLREAAPDKLVETTVLI